MKRQFYDVTPDLARGHTFHRDKLKLRTAIFWLSFFLAVLCLTISIFRYLAYAVPIFVLLTCLADGEISIGEEVRPFLIAVVCGLMLGPITNTDGWKDLFFLLAGVSIALLATIPQMKLWTIFWWLMGGFIFQFVLFGGYKVSFHFDLMKSESTFEGNFSFVFGLLVPFALAHRQYLLAFLSMVMAVLTLKRIALVAAVGAAVMVLIGPKRGKWILNPVVMLGLNAFVVVADMAYTMGALDWIIQQFTGQSANQFGMGRQSAHRYVVEGLYTEPFRSLVGHGMGSVYKAAEAGFGLYDKVNLHSDILKLCYEVGFLATMVIIWFMYACKHYMLRVGFWYFNILFFTDNALIYFVFTAFFFLILRLEREGSLDTTG